MAVPEGPAARGGAEFWRGHLASGKLEPKWLRIEYTFKLMGDACSSSIHGAVPTYGHATIPKASGSISLCFDGDPKLVKL
jgi:hypothetical protein